MGGLEVQEYNYRYIYNYRTKILRDIYYYNKIDGETHRPVKIKGISQKILMLLSDGELHKEEDIIRYIWGKSNIISETNNIIAINSERKKNKQRILVEINRLRKKVKKYIQIKNKTGIGYYIDEKEGRIWLE